MAKMKVALFGWEPAAFFKYNSWPGLTEETLKAQIEADISSLVAMGVDAKAHYITAPDTAYDMVVNTLAAEEFDVILVGAGVRKVDANFILFEAVINAIHTAAPKSKICFNTNPTDTADAVKRWL